MIYFNRLNYEEKNMKIGFIGLGLIGGSIAKTIKKKLPDTKILAYDIDRSAMDGALSDGAIDSALTDFTPALFSDLDIVFLCAPVHSNTEYLPALKEHLRKDAILTDVGSVKGEINEIIESAGLSSWFIGGHPMAGSEKSGYRNSNDHLIENAYYILTPSSDVSKDKIDTLNNLIEQLGSIPLVLTPEHHDYATAAISHLPHVIAYSLVNLVKASDDPDDTMKLIAAGGFKDITRIASSSPEMWKQICVVNHSNISKLLSDYIDSLSHIKDEIDNLDGDSLYSQFSEAREYRNSFIEASRGPIKKAFALYCDLVDESGALAAVAAILAGSAISIKNMGIVNNREFQDGALRVEFYTENELERARTLLEKFHYIIYK